MTNPKAGTAKARKITIASTVKLMKFRGENHLWLNARTNRQLEKLLKPIKVGTVVKVEITFPQHKKK